MGKVHILGLFFLVAHLQLESQKSLNMALASRYDDDQLPQQSGVAYNDVWGYAYPDGREIAIIGTLDSIWIYEVTNPFQIRRVFSFKGAFSTIWREFKTYGHYLYAITDAVNEGLTVIDLKGSPDSIKVIRRDQSIFLKSHMLFVDTATAHLYLAGARDSAGPVDLIMLNLQPDPGHPVLIKKIDLPGNYMHDLFVRNDTAYCSHGYNGFYIYKIEGNGDFTELGSITSYSQQGYNHSSWLHKDGRYLVWADETHNTSLKMVDVSDPSNPDIIRLFRSALEAPRDTASIPHNPYFKGDYAYVSYYHDGVVVFNCADPRNPFIIAYYDTEPSNVDYSQNYAGAWGVYPFLPSGTILASDIQNGLFVLFLDFQLALCAMNWDIAQTGDVAHIQWDGNANSCMDEINLQRAIGNGVFEDMAHWTGKLTNGSFEDKLEHAGNYYYRMRWKEGELRKYSAVKQIKVNKNGFYFQPSTGMLHSERPETVVRSIRAFGLDGAFIKCWDAPVLPLSLEACGQGHGILLEIQHDNQITAMKVLLK